MLARKTAMEVELSDLMKPSLGKYDVETERLVRDLQYKLQVNKMKRNLKRF